MDAIARLVSTAPEPKLPAPVKVTRLPARLAEAVVVERKPSGFVVKGERVERLLERTNLESEGGLARFQSELDRLGVNAALEAAGVKPGDTVTISGIEFEYQP
jgi:Obg family GTPase CgtA-like protein